MAIYNPNDFYPRTGAEVKSDGTTVNEADGINPDGSQNEELLKIKSTTYQTQTNLSISANTWNDSAYYPCDGYDKLAVNLLSDSNTASNTVQIAWSMDGINKHGQDTIISAGSNTYRSGLVDVKSPYFRISVLNGDATNPHVMSAWAYLKA